MEYNKDFRNTTLIRKLSARIKAVMPGAAVNIMEVCGTHTQSFFRFGLRGLIPDNLRLVSGPGCPVCVSPEGYIDVALSLAKDPRNIILTFADMLRVPGTKYSLEVARANRGNVRVLYSPLEALEYARKFRQKRLIFLAVGFETTAPTIALTIKEAKKEKINNLSFLCALKLVPAAMEFLLTAGSLRLDGFLCPGHVSAIIGTRPYELIAKKYKTPCVIAGFEPLDILEGLYLMLEELRDSSFSVKNQYQRAVPKDGNIKAKKIIADVFSTEDADWRGLGLISKSGLRIRRGFQDFDASRIFNIKMPLAQPRKAKECRCADVLKGLITPPDCPLFSKSCSPDKPVGPCMVSNEGACNAYYKYKD